MSSPDILSIVPPSEDPRIRVLVDHDESRITAEVIEAFARSGRVFEMNDRLVEPKRDPARRIKNLVRPVKALRMVELKPARVRNLASELCRFVKKERAGEVCVNPPEWLAGEILGKHTEWIGIPSVAEITENPTFRADGTINDVVGYDVESGTYCCPEDGVTFPPVPQEPTLEEARAAYQKLMEPLCDFPFLKSKDRSVAGALVLTILARPAIKGPTPPFAIRTPTPRTGKDLLTDAASVIGTGREVMRRTLPRDDTELKKVLLSISLSGCRVTSFGNCEGMVGSPALSHAVTSETIGDRALGGNDDVGEFLRTVWVFNGNNIKFKSDFAQRVITCDMDAKIQDPQKRMNWRFYPLIDHIKRDRPELLTAGLTVLRAFHVAGRPRHGKSRRGSYDHWDDLIRSLLIWLGEADPIDDEMMDSEDDDADAELLRSLLCAWRNAFGATAVTLSDAVECVRPSGMPPVQIGDAARKDLIAAFSAINPKLDDKFTAASIRYYFRHNRGKRVHVGDVREGGGNAPHDPRDVLRLEVANPRTGPSKVASWHVLDEVGHAGDKRPEARTEVKAHRTADQVLDEI